MITALDIENTFRKGDSMPYSGDNMLVSCGYLTNTDEKDYLCFYHADQLPTPNNVKTLQDVLNRTETACPQELTYLSMELAIKAQEQAEKK